MIGVEITADQMRAQLTSQGAILDRSARAHAAERRVVKACAAAWAAEVRGLQATLVRHLLVHGRSPQYRYFELAQGIARDLSMASADEDVHAADAILRARAGVARLLEPVILEQWTDTFGDLGYLEALPPMTDALVQEFTSGELNGRSREAHVAARRRQAQEAMLGAQTLRMRGDTTAAIRQAYESDFHSLDAYLVESATAAGDVQLLSVSTRWDLCSHAIAGLAGLPDAFVPAVAAIRGALIEGIGAPEGQRLAVLFVEV